VFEAFPPSAMKRAHAHEIDSAAIERLAQAAFQTENDAKGVPHTHVRKGADRQDVSVLAAACGIQPAVGAPLLFGETAEDHLFVQEEQMMLSFRWCGFAMWTPESPPR